MIPSLIDKQDSFEIVRDQIAAILASETASQTALATAAGKDPTLWALKIYKERADPWEAAREEDLTPIVNVWYETSTFDSGASNIMERQAASGIFNIDCYGFANSRDVSGGGHAPGDEAAALEMQRALRLARNILMSAVPDAYLGLQGLVGGRMPDSITTFQAPTDQNFVTRVMAARLALRVTFNEFSPQHELETLDFVSIDVNRAEDGQILVEADYDYT